MNTEKNKMTILGLSILFDALGCLTYIVPLFGEGFDILWAPVSAFLMTKLYKGTSGKVGAAISFIEEAMPGLDIIPTFTIMWFYTYVFSAKKPEETTIDVN